MGSWNSSKHKLFSVDSLTWMRKLFFDGTFWYVNHKLCISKQKLSFQKKNIDAFCFLGGSKQAISTTRATLNIAYAPGIIVNKQTPFLWKKILHFIEMNFAIKWLVIERLVQYLGAISLGPTMFFCKKRKTPLKTVLEKGCISRKSSIFFAGKLLAVMSTAQKKKVWNVSLQLFVKILNPPILQYLH